MNSRNDKPDLMFLLEKVKNIAVDAGKLIMDIYQRDFSDTIKNKKDKSPVTIADKKANDFIVVQLNNLCPDIPIIAEESLQIDYKDRKNFKYFWLVDPLDGTKEFINKNGDFTINIALIEKDSPVLGVVFVPVENKLYWAYRGSKSFMKTPGKIENITVSKYKNTKTRILLSRSHLDKKTIEYLRNFDNPTVNFRGSALKFLLIAEGLADLYFRFTPTMEWDTAASHIILKEAGGNIFDIDSGHELRYNKTSLANPGFVAKPVINLQ